MPDELGVARRQLGLDEVEVLLLHFLRELLAPDRLLEHVHQVDRVGRHLLGVEVEGAGQHLEGEPGRDPVHAFIDPRRVAVLLARFGSRIGIFQALAVIDPHLRIQVRVLMRF